MKPLLKIKLHGWPDVPLTAEQVAENAQKVAEYLQALKAQRVEIARMGGLALKGISTPAKRRASRENGRRGGRPRGKAKKNAPKTALAITRKG